MVVASKRRAPGEVRDAIVKALANRPKGASIATIHVHVEASLGGSVPKSSVRSYLNLGTASEPPRFKRCARGHYVLVKSKK